MDDDFDLLNDADELAFFDKLDKIGTVGAAVEDEEEEELLVIPSNKSNRPRTSFSEIHAHAESPGFVETDDEVNEKGYTSEGAESLTRFQSDQEDSNQISSKRGVTFKQLDGIHAFQDRNRALIRAQANFLHPRAVLFVGSVMSVTVPSSVPFDVEDSELLYRVLFIEGGNQPAMFRCKTPIFTSSAITLSHQVAVWDDHTFRFDMLMPDTEPGEDPHYLNIQGEVMLSIYRKKVNGGNDLIAQFSVDLTRMKQRGTKEMFEKDHDQGETSATHDALEGRSMNGIFPLQIIQPNASRKADEEKDSAPEEGEIEIQFNIAWHRDDPRGDFAGGDGASIDGDGRTSIHSKSRTSSAGLQRPSKAAATVTAGTTKSSSVGQRPKSATATSTVKKTPQVSATNQYKYEQPRKIVSKLDRQRREMERKISRENQLLHSKIAKQVPDQGPNKSHTSASLSQNKLTAYQNYDAVLSSVKKSSMNGGNNNQTLTANPRVVTIPPDVLEKESPQWRQYQQLHESLKKDIRDEENRVKDLRAKLSNLNTQIQRQEASADKATRITQGAVGSGASTAGSRHTQHAAAAAAAADAKETASTQLRTSRDSKLQGAEYAPTMDSARMSATIAGGDEDVNNVELGSWSQLSYMPGGLENVQDGEYRQLAEEFQVLQKLRRSLLERIAEAKKLSGNASSQQQELDDKLAVVKQRLWHIKQHHTDEFGSIIQLSEAPASSSVAGKKQLDAKDDGEDDLTLYDRLLSLRTEITTLQIQGGFTLAAAGEDAVSVPSGPAHPEILALQSTRSELESMLFKLNSHIERAEVDIARLQQEEKEKLSLISDVATQREWIERRSFIAEMHSLELRLRREERLNALAQATKDVELQMIHYRMVAREREELREQKELLEKQQAEYMKAVGTNSRPRSPSPTLLSS